MDIQSVLAGAAVGAGFGFVLQRGRFCLNTAFRNAFYIRDFTLFRSYILALVIALVGVHVLEFAGLVSLKGTVPEFRLLANILGGYLFGIGMVLAGGDVAGAWYHVGEGLVGSGVAALGVMIGAAAAFKGMLSGFASAVERFVVSSGSGYPLTIPMVLNVPKWIVILPVSAAGLLFVAAGKPSHSSAQAGYHWRSGGILVGVIIVLAVAIRESVAGTGQGISLIGPSEELLMSVVRNRPWNWGVGLIAGIPLGAFLSAIGLREFSWRAPRADVLIRQFAGGVIMGIGGMLAGGCSIGHGLTGMAVLSVASLVSFLFILLGAFTMVYFLFMRGSSA